MSNWMFVPQEAECVRARILSRSCASLLSSSSSCVCCCCKCTCCCELSRSYSVKLRTCQFHSYRRFPRRRLPLHLPIRRADTFSMCENKNRHGRRKHRFRCCAVVLLWCLPPHWRPLARNLLLVRRRRRATAVA
jgi:hypothetical protein